MKIHFLVVVTIALLFSTLIGCARPFTAIAPDGFAAYRGGRKYRAVNHERVVYRVRHLKNKPYAQFPFWREALPKKMTDSGYRIIRDTVITIDQREALLLDLAAPMGETDYSYIVMMTVKGNRILVAEAAGEVDRVRTCRGSIVDALHRITLK